jgi:hypothetical protein
VASERRSFGARPRYSRLVIASRGDGMTVLVVHHPVRDSEALVHFRERVEALEY